MRRLVWSVWIAVLPLFVGCSAIGFGSSAPDSVVLRVKAAPDLNPNDRGEPTPVDLRVYQLNDGTAFTQASYDDLWTKAKQVLGSSFLGEMKVLTFQPEPATAAPSAQEIRLDPKVKYLGLMGLFSAERKEGLEERKRVITIADAQKRVILLTKHQIQLEAPTK